jgi:hypothetical protein
LFVNLNIGMASPSRKSKVVDGNEKLQLLVTAKFQNPRFFKGWLVGCGFMVFNATFNNISVISWRSVLLVEESGESHRPLARH